MTACKFCQTELDSEHSAIIAQRIEDAMNWEKFESTDTIWGIVDNATISIGGDTVQLVARKLKPYTEELEEGYYSGSESEYPQGTIYEVFVVLAYKDRFFKKVGEADSYGTINWSAGHVTEVKPKVVSTTVWE
jgi:hypothetical protein